MRPALQRVHRVVTACRTEIAVSDLGGSPTRDDEIRKMYETLGSRMRAYRLGFRWLDSVMAYMRLSDLPESCFLIEIAPADQIPSKGVKRAHRCWWEGNSDDGLADDLSRLCRRVLGGETQRVRVKRFISFAIDDDGRPVRRIQNA